MGQSVKAGYQKLAAREVWTVPVTLQMGSRQNSAQIEQHQSLPTCVKASPVVMGVGIQGKGYATYFLEGLWKDLCERRKCECDVDNLNIKL